MRYFALCYYTMGRGRFRSGFHTYGHNRPETPILPFRWFSILPFRLLSLAILLTFACCKSFKEPDFKNVENIKLSRLGKKESVLRMDVRYYNPNKTRLKLKEATGEAWIDDQFLGNFKLDTLVYVPGQAEFTLPVSLQVEMGPLVQNSLVLFLNKEVNVKLEGRARVGKGIIFINYPIRYEGKQNLGKLLK